MIMHVTTRIYEYFFNSATVSTICPGSSDPFYIVSYYMKLVTTSWTYGTVCTRKRLIRIVHEHLPLLIPPCPFYV